MRCLMACSILPLVAAITLIACASPVSAYSESFNVNAADLDWAWSASPVFPSDEASRIGFDQPILRYSASRLADGFELYAFASVPNGDSGWPNANISGGFIYSSYAARKLSYLEWKAQGYSLVATTLHDPADGAGLTCPPQGMGDALFGSGGSGGYIALGSASYAGGATHYKISGPTAWAVVSYSYWNNEYITDYSEVRVRASVSSISITLHWTELTISASSVEAAIGRSIQFYAFAKDGAGPYSYSWDFGDGTVSYDQSPSKQYSRPGNYTVTCTATDALGVQDTKTLKISAGAYLKVNPSSGGSTDPPPGEYAYFGPDSIPLIAVPYGGYVFSHWLLDGMAVGGNPLAVSMETNHSVTPVFAPATYPAEFDFKITKSGDATLQQGSIGSVVLTVDLISGDPQEVALTAAWVGSPAGSLALSKTSVTPNPTGTSTLSISAYSNAVPGNYIVRITGNGGEATRAADIAVSVTAAPPSPPSYYYLTVGAAVGGSTTPSPGTYQYSSGSVVVLNAFQYQGYSFQKWAVNNVEYTDATIQVVMDSNKTAIPSFAPTQQPPSNAAVVVLPCTLSPWAGAREQLPRIVIFENFGVNVTGTIQGVTAPTSVAVTAWLSPTGAVWYDPVSGTVKATAHCFTGNTTTDSSGRFTIAFGDLSGVHYTTSSGAAVGSQHYAYANITVGGGGQTYQFNSTWLIDSIKTTAEFDYNITGATATFRFVYASDGSPITGRAGQYRASLEGAYSALAGGTINQSRLSTPCDASGTSTLFVDYGDMNASLLRGDVQIPVWGTVQGEAHRLTWFNTSTITYTTLAPVIYQQNETCITVEAVDWGDREGLTGVLGVQAILYWDTYAIPFNGREGLLGYYGPATIMNLVKDGGSTYVNATGSGCGLIPVDATLTIPEGRAEIAAAIAVLPNIYQTAYLDGGPEELWLQIVPGHSSGILYNPVREGKILVASRM